MSVPHPPDVYVPPRPRTVDSYSRAHAHASQRLRERYGLEMGVIEFTRLCLELAASPIRALPLASRHIQAGERVLLNLRIQGVACRAVYSLRHGVIVTFVPAKRAGPANFEASEHRWRERQRQRMRRRYRRRAKHKETP